VEQLALLRGAQGKEAARLVGLQRSRRKFSLEAHLEVTSSFWQHITAGKIPDGGEVPMQKAKRVSATFALRPLLPHSVSIPKARGQGSQNDGMRLLRRRSK